MENKQLLKSFLTRIEKDYKVDASVYGTKTTEANSVYAIIFINDDYLYLGYQENETDNAVVKQIELDKIHKVSFQGSIFMVQVKDEVFNFSINTAEEALRAMCKEFKSKKTIAEVREGGDIMSSSVGQTRKTVDKPYVGFDRITPFGLVKETESLVSQSIQEPLNKHEDGYLTPESNVENQEELEQTKLFNVQAVEEALGNEYKHEQEQYQAMMDHTIVTPAIHEENVRKEVQSGKDLFAEMLNVNNLDELEPNNEVENKPVKEDTSKIKISLITDELSSNKGTEVVPEKPKPLTKKELKKLEKQRKQEEKEERDLYRPTHPVRNTILVILAFLLIYVLGSYALAKSNIIVLPLSNLVEILLDYSTVLISNMTK